MEARKMMGFEVPSDQRVPVSVRDWTAMKLAMWRSMEALKIAAREAVAIIDRCHHEEGCPGKEEETASCFAGCPDREIRMSALVVLNAARVFSPINANRPNEPYFAPSRERYSETLAELGVAQIERDVLREALRAAGIDVPAPPPNEKPAELPESLKDTEFTLPEEEETTTEEEITQ